MARLRKNIFFKILGIIISFCIFGYVELQLFKFHTMFHGFLKPIPFIVMLIVLYYYSKFVQKYYKQNFN